MTQVPIEEGLRRFLEVHWERPVVIDDTDVATVGATRRNVLFVADVEGERVPLVATVIQTAALQRMDLEAEAATIRLAGEHGVPVADVVAVCPDPSFVGGPFLLTARVDGRTLPRHVLRAAAADPALGLSVARACGDAMARLHAIDVARVHPAVPRPVGQSAEELALAHIDDLLADLLQPSPTFCLAYSWLDHHRPLPRRPVLVHSDWRTGNLMVGDDGLRAVLDWEGSHLGAAMEDPAWMCIRMWRFGRDELVAGGLARLVELRRSYEAAGGTWDEEAFTWWSIRASVWWGLMLARQAREHLDGSAPSLVHAASGRRVAELEWDTLMLLGAHVAVPDDS